MLRQKPLVFPDREKQRSCNQWQNNLLNQGGSGASAYESSCWRQPHRALVQRLQKWTHSLNVPHTCILFGLLQEINQVKEIRNTQKNPDLWLLFKKFIFGIAGGHTHPVPTDWDRAVASLLNQRMRPPVSPVTSCQLPSCTHVTCPVPVAIHGLDAIFCLHIRKHRAGEFKRLVESVWPRLWTLHCVLG